MVRVRLAGVLMLVAVVVGGPAWGTPACGVLLTNVASATYRSQESWASAGMEVEYNVTLNVLVETPNVTMEKVANPTIQAPGGTVMFCISVSNVSACASAANVMVEDVVPDNMTYVQVKTVNAPPGGEFSGEWSNDGGGSWNPVPAPAQPGGPWPAAWMANVSLRWTIDLLGMGQSAYICYRATID